MGGGGIELIDSNGMEWNGMESLDASCVSEREPGKVQRYHVGAALYAMNAIGYSDRWMQRVCGLVFTCSLARSGSKVLSHGV